MIFMLGKKSERKQNMERKKESNLISMIHRVPSIGIHRARTKVYHLNKGYAWLPKTKDFTKDPNKEIWGNWIFRA